MPPQELTTRRVPTALTTGLSQPTRSRIGGPRQEALPLSISFIICFRLLKAACLTLCLYSDTFVSADACMTRAYVFEPSRPLACNINLVLFYFVSRVVL
jgi:hypothetical protein